MKKVIFYLVLILAAYRVAAQQYGMYQTCEAGITFLNHNINNDIKLPGTLITLSNYSHQLQIKSLLPVNTGYSDPGNFNNQQTSIFLDLKMLVPPNRMQRYLTSESVFSTNGILSLNNTSKQVSVQYSPYQASTENEGQMLVSIIVTTNLSDFFPGEYPNEPIVFFIGNGIVNRH